MPFPRPKHLSNLCRTYEPSLRMRNGSAKYRNGWVRAIVIHHTGSGPYLRWRESGAEHNESSPFFTAFRRYQTPLPNAPHYIVGPVHGTIHGLTPEDYESWGVGSQGWGRYENPKWAKSKQFEWWRKKWPELKSPLEFADGMIWHQGSVNHTSVHIEVTPSETSPRPEWSDKCIEQLELLCRDICKRHNIPFDKYHIVGHADVHPRARTTLSGKPWDPHPHQWSFDRFR